jgi:hypothetical protein
MSALLLPEAWARGAVAVLGGAVVVTPLGAGLEARTATGPVRRRWTLGARTLSLAEARACADFYAAREGMRAPFGFRDPLDASLRTVRFDTPELTLAPDGPGRARLGEVTLVEVIGEAP